MFAGRNREIYIIEQILIQTKANFLLTGQHGIGKTSILNSVKF